ncbi:Colicin V production protein [Anatilimnocola aggregata]|uniref:Colicin V production protein n=1 Tax=Anatilimnocola aggregata TaxID=2528021 RepID=A0A517YB90_9BACT|nr:CvpA family protein [Anatilimnocola aggregata]QDU27471.1 Colicin V production protein [Anatilimnocola aggregata]
MQGYDFLMIGVLVGAIAWGAWKGFAWQVASTASMVLSYFVALNFRAPVAQMISTFFQNRAEQSSGAAALANGPWNVFGAMLILFLGTSLVVWLCFNFVSQAIERMKLKEFDRQVGAVMGLAKGVLLCIIITLFSMTLLEQPQRQAIINSRSGNVIAQILAKAESVLPPEILQVLAPYIDGLENRYPTANYGGAFEPARDLLNTATQQFEKTYQAQPASSYYGGQPASNYAPNGYAPTTGQPGMLPSFNGGQPTYIDPQMADRYRQAIPPVQPPGDRPY